MIRQRYLFRVIKHTPNLLTYVPAHDDGFGHDTYEKLLTVKRAHNNNNVFIFFYYKLINNSFCTLPI